MHNDSRTAGQAAYDAYTYEFDTTVISWKDLPPRRKAQWRRIASSVVRTAMKRRNALEKAAAMEEDPSIAYADSDPYTPDIDKKDNNDGR